MTTVEEARKAKDKLEKDMLRLIFQFTNDTGITVKNVSLVITELTKMNGQHVVIVTDLTVEASL